MRLFDALPSEGVEGKYFYFSWYSTANFMEFSCLNFYRGWNFIIQTYI